MQPFIKIEEIIFALADIDITKIKLPGTFFYLQKNLVEIPEVLRIAIRLYWYVVVGYGSG